MVFAGTPEIAIPSLRAIVAAGHDVVAVLTRPDAPGKRGRELHPSPVRIAADELGLRVLAPERASAPEFVDRVADLDADVAAVVAFGQILKPALLAATRLGWVNLHFSLLPAWRGAAPVQRAIMAGDAMTGASTFLIEEGLDTGPVIGTLVEPIRARDTAGDLLARLGEAGAPLLVSSIEALGAGTAMPAEQGDDGVSHAAKLTRDDALVRWDLAAHLVDRHIRGCTPNPGAWTTLPDGSIARIGPVTARPDLPGGAPGTIRFDGGAVVVATGTDPVELGWIAAAGRREMPAQDWWRGARLAPGAQLGEA